MRIIIHRVNTIEHLLKVPTKYGVEIDVRGYGSKLLLSHDPIDESKKYDELEDYIKSFNHNFIIFNLKEAGYESRIIALAQKYNINDYFLLDVEFPYLYKATRENNFKKIAVRFSEAEPVELAEAQIIKSEALVDWIWIDTNTKLPLTKDTVERLKFFKTCLVCPERWGRPNDISAYRKKMKSLGFSLDAVMTSDSCAHAWE